MRVIKYCLAFVILFQMAISFAFEFNEISKNDWKHCANENEICKFDGTRLIRFGHGENWNYSVSKEKIKCSVFEFGDPLKNVFKKCEYGGKTNTDIEGKINIQPIFYVTSGSSKEKNINKNSYENLKIHLSIAENFYSDILKTKIDNFTQLEPIYFYGKYTELDLSSKENKPDTEHQITKEFFEFRKTNRFLVNEIYLFIIVRQNSKKFGSKSFGGARTFNGGNRGGGGIIFLELSSLEEDFPYPFQSTLVHEIGHSLGLTHSDCYGISMQSGNSIMSYNVKHKSSGFSISTTPGTLTEQEKSNILENNRFLINPSDELKSSVNKFTSSNCLLGPMENEIGSLPNVRGIGYDLYFNSMIVSGPDAMFYSKGQATNHCNWHRRNKPNINVMCKFIGVLLEE